MKTNYFHCITVLLLFALNFGVAHATEPVTVSLDEVMAFFFQRNLDLIAAQYNIDQAHADQIIASAIPNPTFGFQLLELARKANVGSNAQGCNPDVSCGFAQVYTFSQLIEVAGKRGLRMESSGFATKAAENDFRDAIRIFSNMVRGAYYDLLQAQKNRWLAQEILKHYDEISKANLLRLKKGDVSESDFLRVQMEAIKAESDVDNAQATVEQAQASLAVILRWPDKSLQFEAKDQFPVTVINTLDQNADKEKLISQAIDQRPDLLADKQRAEQAGKELELANRLIYPDVTANAGYARDPSNNNLNSFFVGFSVPIPAFYQYQGESDKAVASLRKAKLAAEQTELGVRNDVVATLAAWKSADKVVRRFEAGLLGDAQAVRDSSEFAFRKGATGVLDFIEAQRSYKNIMHDYYAAMINRTKAYFDLLKALGEESTNEQTASTTASKINYLPKPVTTLTIYK